ncbi:lamin tail domain-containing protein, partial [Nanoarchaeota archaeon]
MKATIYAIIILLLTIAANAVVINQVLYSPSSTDSGGEAVELVNNNNQAVDISNWYLKTETSSKDAIVPEGTMLNSNQSYLIADVGWSEVKENFWRQADHEEAITMSNTNAGVALVNSDDVIVDAVGWGSAAEINEGLYEGTPHSGVTRGSSLLRLQNTNDNVEDFIESIPFFLSEDTIVLTATIESHDPTIADFSMSDDLEVEGFQVLPMPGTNRDVEVIAEITNCNEASLFFEGQEFVMEKNQTNFTTVFQINYSLQARNYSITVACGTIEELFEFELLPVSGMELITRSLHLSDETSGNIQV